MNFSEKSCKKCLIWWKNTENHRFGQNFQFFEQTTMSWHFHDLFRKNLQKVPHFLKKHDKSSISPKLATFRKNYHVFTFRWTLWQKLAKGSSFREKARKLIDLTKTMQLFPTNYHVLVFRWTFQQIVAKNCSIRAKARKVIHLAKTLQLFQQTTLSFHFDELFRKKLQKVPHFVNKHEKPSIWPELSTFRANYHVIFGIFMTFLAKSCRKCLIWWKSTRNHRFGKNYPTFLTNYHVFAFWWSFKENVRESGSFREKARKLVDLVKTWKFSRKLPCFDV